MTVWDLGGAPKVDVSDPSSIKNALQELGKVDVLVNNAGIAGPNKPTLDYPIEEWSIVAGDLAHGALAARAFERIDFVDLVDQARPGRAHARDLVNTDFAGDHLSGFSAHSPALPPVAIRAPAGVAHQVLEAIGDVSAELHEPIGAVHDLEVALEGLVHP